MAKTVDPDLIAQTTDVIYDTTAKTIQVLSTGAISATGSSATNGVTLQCLYSFTLEEWRDDPNLIKFQFPFTPITAEQFELVNGWTFADSASEQLIRDAGWAVRNTSGNITEMWANIATLGSFDAQTDLAYFQQDATLAAVDFDFSGEVNQAVQILDDPDGNGDYADGYDRRGFLKVFLREENKLFDSYDLIVEQSPTDEAGITQMTYRKYALPLSNGTDLKYIDSDANIAINTPYTDIDIDFLPTSVASAGVEFSVWAAATAYPATAVVQGSDGRWYLNASGPGTSAGDSSDLANGSDTGLSWVSYPGERQIGDNWYPFTVIIDANADDLANGALKEDVYEKVQYSLRQNSDVSEGVVSVNGKTADDLLEFVGDTLVTKPGVYIDDFNSVDTNSITFTDAQGGSRTFPFVAAGTLIFNDTLQNDTFGKYFMFFTNDDAGDNLGNDFDTAGATLVQEANSSDITGDISSNPTIAFNYDYDGNVQRGAASAGTDVPFTAIALGRGTAQYVLTTGTLTRSISNSVNFVASLERTYLNP